MLAEILGWAWGLTLLTIGTLYGIAMWSTSKEINDYIDTPEKPGRENPH